MARGTAISKLRSAVTACQDSRIKALLPWVQGVFETEEHLTPATNTLLQDSKSTLKRRKVGIDCDHQRTLFDLQKCMLRSAKMPAWKRDRQWCTLAASLSAACTSSAFACATLPPALLACRSCCQAPHISRFVLRTSLSVAGCVICIACSSYHHDHTVHNAGCEQILTQLLQAVCNNKKGLLAPGMEDEIMLEFCPTEWRYYYDCLRIHTQVSLSYCLQHM